VILAGRTGGKGQRTAVRPQHEIDPVNGGQALVILFHRRLIALVIVNGKFHRQFLAVLLNHDAAFFIDQVGPGIHEPLEGPYFR
jgi:hypothetical protein